VIAKDKAVGPLLRGIQAERGWHHRDRRAKRNNVAVMEGYRLPRFDSVTPHLQEISNGVKHEYPKLRRTQVPFVEPMSEI
jgi:hypothetical protein